MLEVTKWLMGHWGPILRAAALLLLGIPAGRLLAFIFYRALRKRLSEQSLMLVRNGIIYGLTAALLLMALHELGFKLAALLGTAGVLGVAVGFASQTSLSNVVSGLFLIGEKPFEVGDALQIGDVMGVVHSIDLLSVKLRTFDNRLVRIPNEVLIKTQFTNVTHFPIRRFDIELGVAFKEDVERVMAVLADVADKNLYSLDEPAPLILFKGFGESALLFLLGVWFEKHDMLNLRNSIIRELKERFDAEGIEIPYPHRTLIMSEAAPHAVPVK